MQSRGFAAFLLFFWARGEARRELGGRGLRRVACKDAVARGSLPLETQTCVKRERSAKGMALVLELAGFCFWF